MNSEELIVLVPGAIITADAHDTILRKHAVVIRNGVIDAITPLNQFVIPPGCELIMANHLTLIPGFIQTHIHLCQTLFRGMADDLELLDWLQLRIFPYENAHNPASLRASAQLGLCELQMGGTTTLLDMGTLRHQETIFEELTYSGIRAFAGKCMIDRNDLFPAFTATTKDELTYTHELAKSFHNTAGGRIKYGFAPRFVLSCTPELLTETKGMMKDFEGSLYHTHSSENKGEIEEVRRLFGKENIRVFEDLNILDDHTVLAHCVHLNEEEKQLMETSRAAVAHCPSSNMKLASGFAPIPEYLQRGIKVSLGADGAPCNNTLSQFTEMRLAGVIHKPRFGPTAMDAKTVFRLATIDGAKALNIEHETGSIEIGKKADLVLLDLNGITHPIHDEDTVLYSRIVYSSALDDVRFVMINGEWVVREGVSLKYDVEELRANAAAELKALLGRV